ncbi:MAG: hypothetical protein ACR2HQ_06485 [Ilumatobacteraceae bacterium]
MTNTPQRYLLPMWDGGGTVAPGLGVARRLIARGHVVHVLADPTIGAQAEQAGCTFTPWQRAPHRTSLDPDQDLLRDWETANPLVMLQRMRDRFIAGPAEEFAADSGDAIDLFRPDVVAPNNRSSAPSWRPRPSRCRSSRSCPTSGPCRAPVCQRSVRGSRSPKGCRPVA